MKKLLMTGLMLASVNCLSSQREPTEADIVAPIPFMPNVSMAPFHTAPLPPNNQYMCRVPLQEKYKPYIMFSKVEPRNSSCFEVQAPCVVAYGLLGRVLKFGTLNMGPITTEGVVVYMASKPLAEVAPAIYESGLKFPTLEAAEDAIKKHAQAYGNKTHVQELVALIEKESN